MTFDSWKWFLFLTLVCLALQAFFAMMEMASVSFNKVRLQYYVSKKEKRAIWLSYLLQHPALLFGSTLIGVNTALLIGSECSRRFYSALGLSPDWAPLSQVFIVLIFAEIGPMFAGRRYAEHAAKLGVPFLYFFALFLRPFIWLLDLLCKFINRLFKVHSTSGLYLSREELQNVIEEREESIITSGESFNTVVSNIFSLKNKVAKELMLPIKNAKLVPSSCSVEELQNALLESYTPCVPIFHKDQHNIVAIAYPRDLLRLGGKKKVRDHSRTPWFITEDISILQILKQFRRNNQNIAIVLNQSGLATGLLTLDAILDAIIGKSERRKLLSDLPVIHHIFMDRTLPADMSLEDFNKTFHVKLQYKNAKTLEEVMTLALGHIPSKGESVKIDQFELTVEDAALLGIKNIAVRTIY